jgi:L-threonylcarbamoyladenylate synthase
VTDWLPADHPDAPSRAASVIRSGGLIILPTDTVYGVASDLWQPDAVAALYAAKRRPPDRAIPILLSTGAAIDRVAVRVPEAAHRLASAFWPGPLTIVVPKRPSVPDIVSSLPTIGVRVPDHDAARAAIHACGGALAVTSANLSDQPSALTAKEAASALGAAVGLVLDGGPAPGGTPSTVVDMAGGTLTILRPGPIDEAALRAVVEGN